MEPGASTLSWLGVLRAMVAVALGSGVSRNPIAVLARTHTTTITTHMPL